MVLSINKRTNWDNQMGKASPMMAPDEVLVRNIAYYERYCGVPAKRVLEIGCGHGNNTRWLAQKGYEVIAFDISPACIQIAAQQLIEFDNVSVYKLDLTEGIPDSWGSFDLILDIRTLQHVGVEAVKEFFKNLPNLLNKKGAFIGMMLNRDTSVYPYLLANNKKVANGTLLLDTATSPKGGLEGVGESHFYSRSELERLMSSFSSVEILEYSYELPSYEVRSRLPIFDARYIRKYWVVNVLKDE